MKGMTMSAVLLVLAISGGVRLTASEVVPGQRFWRNTDVSEATSLSGDWHIKVVPSHPYGIGPAKYRLRKEGEVVWEKDLPLTFVEVWIADDGTFAGFGYTFGYEGFGPSDSEGDGELVLAIFDAAGEIVVQKIWMREFGRMLHAPPSPTATGIVFVAPTAQALIDVRATGNNTSMAGVWLVDLEHGTINRGADPAQYEGVNRFRSFAENLPGTPLVLTQWYEAAARGKYGTRFMLTKVDGATVWEMSLPDDYTQALAKEDHSEFLNMVQGEGTIVSMGDRMFTVRSVLLEKEFSYEVGAAPDWKVSEIGSKPPETEAEKPEPIDWRSAPVKKITVASSFNPVTTEPSAVAGAREFALTADGNYVVLKHNKRWSGLIEIDKRGGVVGKSELEFLPDPDSSEVHFCRAEGTVYLVTVSYNDRKIPAEIHRVDLSNGAHTQIATLGGTRIGGLSASQGRFAIYGALPSQYSSADLVAVYGLDGKILWRIVQDGWRGDPGEIMSPEAVVIRGDEVFVLENIADEVSVYDLKSGKFLREYNLEELWDDGSMYVTDMVPVRDGWLINNFGSMESLVFTDLSFNVKVKLAHKFKDGRDFYIFGIPIIRQDGTVCLLADDVLVELDSEGVVSSETGADRSGVELSEVADTNVFGDSLILLMDRMSGTVYGFTPGGELVRRYVVGADDFEQSPPWTRFDVSDDGHVFITSFKLEGKIRFSPEGKRLDLQSARLTLFDMTSSTDKEYPPLNKRPPGAKWSGLGLFDADGEEVYRINRRPDERWIEGQGYVGINKEIAIIDKPYGLEFDELVISYYTDTGRPLTMAEVRFENDFALTFAYDGKFVYVFHPDGVVALDRDGSIVWQASYPKGVDDVPRPVGFLTDGRLVVYLRDTVFVLVLPAA